MYLLEKTCSHQFHVFKMIFFTFKKGRQTSKRNLPWQATSHINQQSALYLIFDENLYKRAPVRKVYLFYNTEYIFEYSQGS